MRLYEYLRRAVADHVGDGCLEWKHSTSTKGYGQLSRPGAPGKNLRSHRVAYEDFNGPIPEGLMVRHTCDNRLCFNPKHLVTGTALENTRDGIERGRINMGREHNHRAKLTEADVAFVRFEFARRKGGICKKYDDLADEFNVSRSCIQQVVERTRWA